MRSGLVVVWCRHGYHAIGRCRMARAGMMGEVTLVYLVQHGEKEPLPGDPGLTRTGREQATHTGRWLHGLKISALCCRRDRIVPCRLVRGRPGCLLCG